MDEEPLLDAADIQGNILVGFRRKFQLFVGYSVSTADALRHALGVLPPITTVRQTLAERDARKQFRLADAAVPERDDLLLNVALGKSALEVLQLPEIIGLDLAFSSGMVPASSGDPWLPTNPDGTPNPANYQNWVVGSPRKPLDLLLIFAADVDISQLADPTLQLIESISGLNKVYQEQASLLPGEIEHFGFKDGISQPGPRGLVDLGGTRRPVTTRYGVPPADGFEFGQPGQILVWPGQFLVGAPTSPGVAESAPSLAVNGSFVVFRRLRQDVGAFYADTEAIARSVAAASGLTLTGDNIRAKIVGRIPAGQPLMRPIESSGSENDLALNYFRFAGSVPGIQLSNGLKISAAAADPDPTRGIRCPVWAHIRKVNPRDLGTDKGGPDETASFQMLRRGIPFGPIYDHDQSDSARNAQERGLLFVSYQRSIRTQFQTLNNDWMNHDSTPMPFGFDLLVGQNTDPSTGLYSSKPADFNSASSAEPVRFSASRQWVIPTGGAFLFAPSTSALRTLSSPM